MARKGEGRRRTAPGREDGPAGSGFEVVRLGPDDWPEHRALRLESLRQAPKMFGASYAENKAYDEARWRDRLSRITYWQARDGAGHPVGMVGLDGDHEPDSGTHVGFLIAMYVRPEVRGRGVGEALVQTVLAEAVARGLDRVVLDVTSTNSHARALYERLGFVETGQEFPHPRDSCLTEQTMVCLISGN